MAKRNQTEDLVRLHKFTLNRGTMRFKCELCGARMNDPENVNCSSPQALTAKESRIRYPE